MVRVFRLGHRRLWLDELTTSLYTRETWAALLGPVGRIDVHPPFYYSLQKAWLVFGSSPASMRALPVLFGVAAIPLLFVLGRRLFGERIGLIAAFLMTTAPLHVEQSRELRMYSLLTASALVALIGLAYALPALQRDTGTRMARPWRAWGLYVIGSVSAFYAHNTALLLPVLSTMLVVAMALRGRATTADLWRCLAAGALILVFAAPWLWVLGGHVATTLANFWIPKPTPIYALSQISGIYPYPSYLKLAMLLLCVAGLWVLRRRTTGLAFVGAFVAGQPLVIWLLSLIRPIMLIRVMVWPSALTLFLPAALLARIVRPLAMCGAIAIVVIAQLLTIRHLYPPEAQSDDFAFLAPRLRAFEPGTDRLLLSFQMLENSVRHASPEPFDRSRVVAMTYGDRRESLEAFFRSSHVRRDQLLEELRSAERIWVVDEIAPQFPIPAGDAVRPQIDRLAAAGRIVGRWTSGNLSLTLIDKTSSSFDVTDRLP